MVKCHLILLLVAVVFTACSFIVLYLIVLARNDDDDYIAHFNQNRTYNFKESILHGQLKSDNGKILHQISELVREYNPTCGEWRNSYRDFHGEQLLQHQVKNSAVKILVAFPTINGLSDRFVGLATTFLVSLILKRVFQIGRRDGLLNLEVAFSSPYINWSRSLDTAWVIQPLIINFPSRLGRDYTFDITMTRKFLAFNTIEDHRMQYKLTHGNIRSAIPHEYETVMMTMNRGKTIEILDNPYHTDELHRLGLTKENAFGCMINFLLQPRPQIFLPIANEFIQMATKSTKLLKIGIQIRIGDIAWHQTDNQSFLLHNYHPFFKCALQIEKFALRKEGSNYTQSMWYILTESLALRKLIQKQFQAPNRVVLASTRADVVIEHSSKERGVCQPSCSQSSVVSETGFQTAAAEWWTLGNADYHVISESSGFGRTAAMRTMKSGSIYTIPPDKRGKIRCGPKDYTPLWKLASDWSGI